MPTENQRCCYCSLEIGTIIVALFDICAGCYMLIELSDSKVDYNDFYGTLEISLSVGGIWILINVFFGILLLTGIYSNKSALVRCSVYQQFFTVFLYFLGLPIIIVFIVTELKNEPKSYIVLPGLSVILHSGILTGWQLYLSIVVHRYYKSMKGSYDATRIEDSVNAVPYTHLHQPNAVPYMNPHQPNAVPYTYLHQPNAVPYTYLHQPYSSTS